MTERRQPFRWGFFSAALTILFLICVGQAIGVMVERFGVDPGTNRRAGPGGWHARDWIFLAFLTSTAVFLFLQRASVARFFRAMHVGVTLVALSCLAVAVGVLIPQIEGFEDPNERVTQANYKEQYDAFRWAEGYFVYHLMHPYGIGMPKAELPPQALEGLTRFGRKYGSEESGNREKQMRAMFSGQAKTDAIEKLISTHDTAFRRFFDVATALHLNRTYKSHWFASLLGLLFVGVGFNTFKGRPSTWLTARKSGFFVVHLGVMTILTGGFISKLKTDRGIMHMDLREPPKDEYWAYNSPDKRTRMPFALKLDRFARKDWPTLEVGFDDANFTSRPPTWTLWPGRTIELDYSENAQGELAPRVRIEVLELAKRAKVLAPRFWEAPAMDDPAGIGPLAQLSIQRAPSDDAPATEETLFLKPDYQSRVYYDPQWNFRLLSSVDAEPDVEQLFPQAEDTLGMLSMLVSTTGDVEPTRVPIELGQKLAAPGGYQLEIQQATANFQLDANGRTEIFDPRPLSEQVPRNPGVWVVITPPHGSRSERRLVLEKLDAVEHKMQDKFENSGLVLKLDWERWASKGPARYVLHWGASVTPTLIGEDGSRVPAQSGTPLPLPGATRVTPRQFINHAMFERNIEFQSGHLEGPQFDPDFYSTDPVGVELRVTTAPGTPQANVSTLKMASTEQSLANVWSSPDERFWLRFFQNDKAFPFEWRSVLSVFEKDADGKLFRVDVGPEREREIRVNDYFYYRSRNAGWLAGGYRFFQTNALPELPTYSGIGVVYDPGIPVVLAGMYLTILGTLLAFIVRPIVEGSRKRAQQVNP